MGGRQAGDAYYSHGAGFGVFAVTVTGTPASLAVDILATAFGGLQSAWKSYFNSNYPLLPDSAMWFISTGAAASGLTSAAVSGVTFGNEVIPANSKSITSFVNDLSKVKLITADAILRIEF